MAATPPSLFCPVYWGSHGCTQPRLPVHEHVCDCCECPDGHGPDSLDRYGCVAAPPYYGPPTRFYGEDVPPVD